MIQAKALTNLRWYIPIGVLFDLLCADPERPWNLTVHFRGYPADILSPCEGEDSVKWNYNNSLKEAAFIITGNSKNVMNMSQADQLAMWESVRKSRRITTLEHALEALLPEFFSSKPTARAGDPEPAATMPDSEPNDSDTTLGTPRDREPASASPQEMDVSKKARVKLVRIEGMELDMDTPFLWVANNLKNPECFLHVCVYIGA